MKTKFEGCYTPRELIAWNKFLRIESWHKKFPNSDKIFQRLELSEKEWLKERKIGKQEVILSGGIA